MTGSRYIPSIPFEGYKWFFATKAPTESLGDPAVLLGLVNRMAKIEDSKTKYSSPEFAQALIDLDNDIETPVDLSRRIGERNLIRNSGQYWKLFGLIPADSTRGIITLTPLARSIAKGDVNQLDFAASMIVAFKLPNKVSYSDREIWDWEQSGLIIHPFKLILKVIRELFVINPDEAWINNDELAYIVVPMAGDRQNAREMANYILAYRENKTIIEGWPNCVLRSNDKRFCGEYLRFLTNYGYLEKQERINDNETLSRDETRFAYIPELDFQIQELIDGTWSENSAELIKLIQQSDISSAVSMSSIARTTTRPGQQLFRRNLLAVVDRCPITGVDLPTVLQAAHIKPHAYGGPENVDNGLPLRADIHCLFDAGLLNIKPTSHGRFCSIELLDEKVRSNYREFIDKFIELPDETNMEYIRWRYDNKLLGVIK